VRFTRTASALWVTLAVLATTLLAYRHFMYGQETLIVLPLWLAGFGMRVVPLAISWFDKPFKVSSTDQAYLDEHRVVVAVPCYNEDPALLDRCLWALVNQTRPPDAIHVVDDGSQDVDYMVLWDYWTRASIPVPIYWTTQRENGGKKVAQSVVFMSHPEADIFVTVDSDTSLERNAIHEGLKPFADEEIMSVAGVEENYNKNVNWLTRSVAARNTYYQLTVWAAQSVRRDLLVNRGTFALYRAWIIRECVPCYIGETFLGRRIKLGDDAALTLFCQWYGKTVQQVSAFSLPMHPETFSHHFRQWTRWARGAVIRNCWRLRYLPVRSYGFVWTVMVWYMIWMSAALPVVFAITWPQSEHVLEFAAVSILAWTYMVAPKICQVRREGETWLYRLRSMLIYPTGIMWATLVLRPVRLYGIVTFLKQRWTTRQHGIEELTVPVGVYDIPPEVGVPALRLELETVT
jgi:hyaluronan synthase